MIYANSFGTFLEALNKEDREVYMPMKVHIDFYDESSPGWIWLYINHKLAYEGYYNNSLIDVLGPIVGLDNLGYRYNVSEEDDYPNFEEEEALAKLRGEMARTYAKPLTPEQQKERSAWAKLQDVSLDEIFKVADAYQQAKINKEHDGSCICGAGCCCVDGCVGACPGHTAERQESFWTAYYKGNSDKIRLGNVYASKPKEVK